jgi:hypothetical protein
MKRSKFTELQIAFILRQADEGTVSGMRSALTEAPWKKAGSLVQGWGAFTK